MSKTKYYKRIYIDHVEYVWLPIHKKTFKHQHFEPFGLVHREINLFVSDLIYFDLN